MSLRRAGIEGKNPAQDVHRVHSDIRSPFLGTCRSPLFSACWVRRNRDARRGCYEANAPRPYRDYRRPTRDTQSPITGDKYEDVKIRTGARIAPTISKVRLDLPLTKRKTIRTPKLAIATNITRFPTSSQCLKVESAAALFHIGFNKNFAAVSNLR